MKGLNNFYLILVLFSGTCFSQGGLLKETLDKKKSNKNYVKDNGIANKFHENHVKQVLFYSNTARAELEESDLKSKFTLTDTLRAAIFLEKSLVNHLIDIYPEVSSFDLAKRACLVSKWYLDGVLIFTEESYIKLSAGKNDSWENEKTTSFKRTYYDKNSNSDYSFFEWKDFVKKAQPSLNKGDHKVELKIFVKDEKVTDVNKLTEIANGSFNLSINKIIFDPKDPIFCGPTSFGNKRDEKTEVAMKNAFKSLGTAKAAVIRSYFVEGFNQIGTLQYRTFTGSIIYEKGGACGYSTYEFKQIFDGQKYTYCEIINSSGGFNTFDCQCLLK